MADRLGLATLLGSDAGVGAGGVDEGEHRQRKLLGQLHQPHRLAIALGARHAEVADDLFLGVAPLLVADDNAGLAVEAREATDDRLVVGVAAVAVQLFEIGEDQLGIIERVRTLRMARDLGNLPRAELGVEILGQRLALALEPLDLVGDVDRGIVLHETQLVDFFLEFGDRRFEIKKGGFHPGLSKSKMSAIVTPARQRRAPHVLQCGSNGLTHDKRGGALRRPPRLYNPPPQRARTYSLLAKPSRCSRLVKRLKIDTNSDTVAMM